MLVDCCRFAGVQRFEDLFPYMAGGWRHHFDRYEWTGAVELASNHIRVSDKFRHERPDPYVPLDDPARKWIVLPHQGLTVNGWSDLIAAGVFVDALNDYALEHWTSTSSSVAIVANPHNPAVAAERILKLATNPGVAAVALPLTSTMLGSVNWDPIYRACTDTGLPLVIHFSGLEGAYAGAPVLAGAPHTNPLSRHILMPQLAESNLASLVFEGAFYRFPDLRVLFVGFGFKWLPSLIRRMDQEWRNFRSDIPWVKDKPSIKVLSNIWASTYPVGEAVHPEHWIGEFSEQVLGRIVFASNAPFDSDAFNDVVTTLGSQWEQRLIDNGAGFLRIGVKTEA
jgi:predicted TIM-barrel fold metal-dependent hydrolase